LGSFSAPGTSFLNLDNSALFLGVKSDTANISRLVFSTSENNRAFAINKLRLATIPEPSSAGAIYALGTVLLIFSLTRKLKPVR
jgi:hypothetical protein